MTTGKVKLFADRLNGMQERTAEIMEGYQPGGIQVPESVYIGKEQCELTETSQSGYLKIARQFTIAEGEYAGLSAFDGFVLEGNDYGIQSARRWVEQHGCTWPEGNLSLLEDIINRINEAAPTVKFKVKYKADKKDPDTKWCNISIMSILDGHPDFSDITGDVVEVAEDVAETVEETVEVEETITDEYDGMNRNQLKKFIADNDLDIRVTTKFTDDDIRNAIREAMGPAEIVEDEAEPEPEPESTVDKDTLLAFCASQGVENVDDTMTVGEIAAVMTNYGFEKNTLTDEEFDMLNDLDLADNIQIPEPKKAAPVKKAPTPPAKAPTAPPAKKAPAPAVAPAKKAPAAAPGKVAAPAKKK